MTGRGKGGKGLGKGSAKRHRKVLRDNIQRITKPAIRRLARRGGVKRISGLIYEETRGVLKVFLENFVKYCIYFVRKRIERLGLRLAFCDIQLLNISTSIMALLQEIRAQYQATIDDYFYEAIATRNYTKVNELVWGKNPQIPAMAVNVQRFLYLALSTEKFPAAQDIVDFFVGERFHGTVDYEDEDIAGWGPLHLVVEDNNYDGATFLLDNGADPDVEAEDGTQPINISVDNKNVQMTKLLLSYGADSCGNREAFKKAVEEGKFSRLRYQWDGDIEV
ncbi:hypothetical protein KQX54_015730 [Cotesia glomerata]|uniref:Histone H4 n=1 Tax=Cotesia glomerata TaxID=32391 RepID=A0AAV7I9X9_COTGL|nr:hypothetical protein KQX54_015730 [Cotesia glomerata]